MSHTRTSISSMGKVAFQDRLLKPFDMAQNSSQADDAAVIDRGDYFELIACDTMFEGVDFDLSYTPLEYLGRKAVVASMSNIVAMNGVGEYVTVSVGISSRFSVEEVEMVYRGVEMACKEYGVRLIGGNTSSSATGLIISTTSVGKVAKDHIARRSGAKATDLVCMTGNLGAALMGLHLLEREKRATQGDSNIVPQINKDNQYLFARLLKPELRSDILKSLDEDGIVPSSMIDITQGLSSALLHLCRASEVGVRVYLERLPISSQVFAVAEELNLDPVVVALNGGDDFELLFTVPIAHHEQILRMPGVDVIGHIMESRYGAAMITPDSTEIALQSPDWTNQE